ncbi:MAG: hypothetical protein AAB731_00780 [Patescibacteria group bacterium]
MEKPKYLTMEELFLKIDEPYRSQCWKIYLDNLELFHVVQGSTNNHQNWRGGYHDHIVEVLNIAVLLYDLLGSARPHPFSLSDTLVILFLHDIEKPWKYELRADGELYHIPSMQKKADQHAFREKKLEGYGIMLTPAQANALKYVEGEGDDYSSRHRVMNELASFCHMCDSWSARGWHGYPLAENDPWTGAKRSGG